jgi:acyl-CoA thioester hydrolase
MVAGDPAPIKVRVKLRVPFSDVDPLGIVWHGRYPLYFEEGYGAITRAVGLSYQDFFAVQVAAPIVQMHIDYFEPLRLDEEFTIEACLFWCDGARINIEYRLLKADSSVAACGYTVQMLVTPDGKPALVPPPLLEACRKKWRAGLLKFDKSA